MNPVPDAYLGVWQRTLLTTTAGEHDRDTRVYWLQTAHLFADLRIPWPAPQTPQQLALQAGFAGVTEVRGEECQWHRVIDLQPPRASRDIGRMHFQRPDYLLEDGLDGSYHEVWERLPDSLGRSDGRWLHAADGRQGCLLLAGDYFLFAASRTQPLPPGSSLGELLARGGHAAELLSFELSFGRHQHGAMPWSIELSSLPGRAGQTLLPAAIDPNHADLWHQPALLNTLGANPPVAGWQLGDCPAIACVQECLS